MSRFHDLTVGDVRPETPDSVSVGFEVPAELVGDYRFQPGQYLTLEAEIGGEPIRRSYSICSGINDGELRVAVKRVDGGRFSGYVNDALKAGDRMRVMTPDGLFTAAPDGNAARTYVAFAAGSGITPILAIAKSVLEVEPRSRFTLLYGNRSSAEIMFRGALQDLKDRFPDRFVLMHVLSREPQEVALFNGRLDAGKCETLFRVLINVHAVDEFYLCGPEAMMAEISATLLRHGVDAGRLHRERFVPATDVATRVAAVQAERRERLAESADGLRSVAIILVGLQTELLLATDAEPVLDAALKLRPDLPYACKGGMCCTCRARVVEGRVEMDTNWTLAAEEIARGFVLTCQSHPVTDRVVLDYDAR